MKPRSQPLPSQFTCNELAPAHEKGPIIRAFFILARRTSWREPVQAQVLVQVRQEPELSEQEWLLPVVQR